MIKKFDKLIAYLENAMLIFGMLSTTFILFANVVMRYGFKSGIVWSNEYANYAIIWIVCGGCGAAVRSDQHMKITAIPDSIKNKMVKSILELIVYIICMVFSGALFYYGVTQIRSMMMLNQMATTMKIPMWGIYLAFPVGGAVMTFRFAIKLVETIMKMSGKGGEA